MYNCPPSSQLASKAVSCKSLKAIIPVLLQAARRSARPLGVPGVLCCDLAMSAILCASKLLPLLALLLLLLLTLGFFAAAAVEVTLAG